MSHISLKCKTCKRDIFKDIQHEDKCIWCDGEYWDKIREEKERKKMLLSK